MIPSYDAESAIIGGLLRCPDECYSALDALTPDDFENPYAAKAFKIIKDGNKNGKTVDAFIFGSENTDTELKQFALVSVETFLTPSNFDGYISAVKELSNKRKLFSQLQEISFSGDDCSSTVDKLSKLIDSTRSNMAEKSEDDFLVDYIKSLDKPVDPSSRIQTGFPWLDKKLKGIRKGSLCYIGAAPSTGKTAFAINMIAKNRMSGKKVLMFSLEMSKSQILDRYFSSTLNIDYSHLDTRNLSEEEIQEVVDMASQIQESNNFKIIDDTYSIESISAKTAQYHPDLLIVDYVQVIQTSQRFPSRKNEVDHISAELKRIARMNNCAVIALSQVARSSEAPSMSSLKESGDLEANGDYIILMHRPYVSDKTEDPHQTFILLDKNKYGGCGTVELYFDGAHQQFTEVETRY